MRFLFINTDYDLFINDLYSSNSALDKMSYDEQLKARNETLFGAADFFSTNLRRLGQEAWDIHFNNLNLQNQWLIEYGSSTYSWRTRLQEGFMRRISKRQKAAVLLDILTKQIKYYRPDVLVNFAVSEIPTSFFSQFNDILRLTIAWAEPSSLQSRTNWEGYKLVICSSECVLYYFLDKGMTCDLIRYGFESTILEKLEFSSQQTIPISFIGSLSPLHETRIHWLENLCRTFPGDLQIWGPGVGQLPTDSTIRKCYQGRAWGRDAFKAIASSLITINLHSSVEPNCADNMRLYEATGLGTLLISDWRQNLDSLFENEREIVAYRSFEECIELIRYYLNHGHERTGIAQAGQVRTLHEHTYYQRMQQLLQIVERYIK